MPQRLATEYVKACLALTETELTQMEHMLAEQGIEVHVKVFDNANQQLMFHEESGEEVVISFEYREGKYVSEGSYRLNSLSIANVMRKAVAYFKGDAIVNRIYSNFTMVYYYERGTVVKIVELNEHYQKVIYEFKSVPCRLEELYRNQQVEREIAQIRQKVNELLDRRLIETNKHRVALMDDQLSELTHRLFVLEA